MAGEPNPFPATEDRTRATTPTAAGFTGNPRCGRNPLRERPRASISNPIAPRGHPAGAAAVLWLAAILFWSAGSLEVVAFGTGTPLGTRNSGVLAGIFREGGTTIGRTGLQGRILREAPGARRAPLSLAMATDDSGTGHSGTHDDDDNDNDDAPVILLVGSCGLDRLLTVASYPSADAKVRTIAYNEEGGGNSANTASAIGKLVASKLFCSAGQQMRVEFLSKVGDDAVGQQLADELNSSNVGTSTDLFRRGGKGSTTAFTTVVVSESEQTRTCIHTPGTCGELSIADDVESLSPDDVDRIFRNVVHLHSDSRHTNVSLWMAREAKRRGGITVSCDCEKDRKTKALDELIEVCDVLFTNSNHLGEYLQRLTLEREAATGRQPLSEPTIAIRTEEAKGTDFSSPELPETRKLIETCVGSLAPSSYFARWQQPQNAIAKEVVVTHGAMGALHYKLIELSSNTSNGSDNKPHNTIEIEMAGTKILRIRHSFDDGREGATALYETHQVGVLKDPKIVDTTGAGDAFIGGYILASKALGVDREDTNGVGVQIALEIGSFVGGRKLGGPGARSALPTEADIDRLGSSAAEAKASLRNILGSFNNIHQ